MCSEPLQATCHCRDHTGLSDVLCVVAVYAQHLLLRMNIGCARFLVVRFLR